MGLPGILTVFKLLSFVFSSWVLIHVFALFGVFAGLTYTFWWFLVPKQTLCFFCKVKRDGETCPVCRSIIKKSDGDHPKSIVSAFANSALLLMFSVISVGVVYLEIQFFHALGFPPTRKSVSFVIPTKGQYNAGEVFPFKVEVSGIETPINTVQMDLSYDPEILEVIDVSTKESFANIFVQKEMDNKVGYVRLTGGLPNPGYKEKSGLFSTVYFRGKSQGVTKVEFLPSTLVLANDGKGTNVIKELSSASFVILPNEEITETKPEASVRKSSEGTNPKVYDEVLGITANDDNWYFYDDGNILGELSSNKSSESTQTAVESSDSSGSLISQALALLYHLDRKIIEFWSGIFDMFS